MTTKGRPPCTNRLCQRQQMIEIDRIMRRYGRSPRMSCKSVVKRRSPGFRRGFAQSRLSPGFRAVPAFAVRSPGFRQGFAQSRLSPARVPAFAGGSPSPGFRRDSMATGFHAPSRQKPGLSGHRLIRIFKGHVLPPPLHGGPHKGSWRCNCSHLGVNSIVSVHFSPGSVGSFPTHARRRARRVPHVRSWRQFARAWARRGGRPRPHMCAFPRV